MPVPTRFKFNFSYEDDNTPFKEVDKAFDVTGSPDQMKAIEGTFNGGHLADAIDKFRENVTEPAYGVHDISIDESCEFWGYTTYEVEPEKWDELMSKWQEFFRSLGFTVSDVYEV